MSSRLQTQSNIAYNNNNYSLSIFPSVQLRLTGSKFETPMTAPTMAPSTTPPETMLSKKFLREGENPGCAASATSGITIAAVSATAVSPATAFSFMDDAWISILPLLFNGDGAIAAFGDSFNIGLKKASEPRGLLCPAEVMASAAAIDEDAIVLLSYSCGEGMVNSGVACEDDGCLLVIFFQQGRKRREVGEWVKNNITDKRERESMRGVKLLPHFFDGPTFPRW